MAVNTQPLKEQKREKVAKLLKQGLTTIQIHERTGVTKRKIRSIKRELNE